MKRNCASMLSLCIFFPFLIVLHHLIWEHPARPKAGAAILALVIPFAKLPPLITDGANAHPRLLGELRYRIGG